MKPQTFFLFLVFVLIMAACREAAPTPIAQEAATAAQRPTVVPTNTATPQPTDTAVPTDTPTPTLTFTPSATPLPLLVVFVKDEADEAVPGGQVLLDDASLTFHAEQTVNADGQATFANLVVGETYTITVKAEGYLDAILPVEFEAGVNELEVALEAGLFAAVVGDDADLRSGPRTVYGRIGTVEDGTVLQVVGQNDEGDWLLVLTPDGEEVWIAAAAVDLADVELADVTAVPAPATPTPAPTTAAAVPVSQPPPAPVVPAGNLLSNPGFESGSIGWTSFGGKLILTYTATDNPQFVHSGTLSAVIVNGQRPYYYQSLQNITPGQTYRVGVWVKVWSSSGENRTISENAGDYAARLCISPLNETDPNKGTSVCTGFVRPLDTWQYISVDAVAAQDTMAVILHSAPIGPNLPRHNEAIWDDISLTISAVAATATPAPAGPPVRPAPIPFNAVALRDNMSQIEHVLNHMGGLLDRLVRGSWETCQEYESYYNQLVTSPTYHSLPDEWNGLYNEYIFAVENAVGFNNGIYSVCQSGGGSIDQHAYGEARSNIANSLNRLIPAVQQANALLGG